MMQLETPLADAIHDMDKDAITREVVKLLEQTFGLRGALADLLRHVDINTCTHEETHRGGAIWTICDGCGRSWADDRGGFVPHVDPPAVAAARKALNPPPNGSNGNG